MNKKRVIIITLLIVFMAATGYCYDDTIYGEKVGIFKDIHIEENVDMIGNIVSIFGDVEIDGNVDGDVVSILGSIDLDGTIDGNTVSILGRTKMAPGSTITQNKVQILGGSDGKASSAIVRGEDINVFGFFNILPGIWGLLIIIMVILTIKTLVALLFSIILVVIAPERTDFIAERVSVNMPRKFGIGLVITIAFYVITPVLAAIFIGIPFLLVLIPLKGLLEFGGNTVVKIALGKRLGRNRDWSTLTELLVGTIIFWLADITIILKPVLYLAKLVGMGAIIDTKIGTVDNFNESNMVNYNGNTNNENIEVDKIIEDIDKEK
ncbi:MAG: hypothetical protein FH751_17090 [Firmicutes bacterium]|nr:hypothetical protein [Bacillota bacterium]